MYRSYLQLYHFLRSPEPHKSAFSSSEKRKLILHLIVLTIFLGFLTDTPVNFLLEHKLIPDPGRNVVEDIDGPLSVLLIVLLGPAIEECLFRWQLSRVRASVLFVGVTMSIFIAAQATGIVTIIAAIIAVFFLVITVLSRLVTLYKWWRKNYSFLFYFTAVSFAIAHISNYSNGVRMLPWTVLYVLPQFFAGLTLGYCRIKLGFRYAILLHASCNLLLLILDQIAE